MPELAFAPLAAIMLPVLNNEATRREVAAFAHRPLQESFSTAGGFEVLRRAAQRLSALHGVNDPQSVSAAAELLFTTSMHHGQTCFIVDYINEVCADPRFSSSDLTECEVLDGTLPQRWLEHTVATVVHRLRKCTADEDARDLGSLHCCVQTCTAVNVAIQTAGLSSALEGVSPGAIGRLASACTQTARACVDRRAEW